MRLEQTLAVIVALLFASGRAHAQAGTFLDPGVGPQAPTGFRVSLPTASIVANFSFSPGGGAWPLTVQFVDTTQGGPASWAWDFGDGGSDTVQNPIHTFINPAGVYTITLTATGPGGSSTTNHTITITNAVPVDVTLNTFGIIRLPYPKLRRAGVYNSFLIHPNSGTLDMCFYDTNTFNQSASGLPQATLSAVGGASAFDYVGTNLFIAGISPFGSGGTILQYHIATSSLPSSVSVVTNFAFGTTSSFTPVLDALSNGGVAIASSETANPVEVSLVYYRPNGTWTNYGVIVTGFGGSVSTPGIDSAEMPGDNSWYVFINKDGSGTIWALKFAITANDLTLVNSFVFADTGNGGIWGSLQPYGETCDVYAISDTSSNRVLLFYNNNTIVGSNPDRSCQLPVVGMNAATNRYLLGIAQWPIYIVIAPIGLSQQDTGKFLSYGSYQVSGQPAVPTSWLYQRFIGETIQTPAVSTPYAASGYNNRSQQPLCFDPHRNHIIVFNQADQTLHLLVYP